MMFFVFFFFKQKTAYEMRISDWSSDVCSSDLLRILRPRVQLQRRSGAPAVRQRADAAVERNPSLGVSEQASSSRGRVAVVASSIAGLLRHLQRLAMTMEKT